MAAFDIMPYNSPMGGHCRIHHYEVGTAGFLIGEPIINAGAGTVAEAATQPTATTLVGIALGPASFRRVQSDGGSTGTAVTTNWRTGANVAAGDVIPAAVAEESTLFITTKLYNNSDTLVVPTLAHIGDEVSLRRTSGDVWGVDIAGATTALVGNIIDVLDADNRSLSEPGAGTGAKVVFKFTVSQWQTVTGL